MTKPVQTNEDNWESSGSIHGLWRTSMSTKAFGEIIVLIHSTSDRATPTEKQKEALSLIKDLPQSKFTEALALIASHYGEGIEELKCIFDLAEIPLIDQSTSTYFYLECDAPDDEHRITILFRDNEILGFVDRDAASEIFEWDSADEIEGLVWEHDDFDDGED